jgi:predicted permease
MNLRSAIARFVALFRQRRLDKELDGEILAHLEMAEQEAIAAGLSREEARRAARRSFGWIGTMKEEHRDQRSVQWMENFFRDFRFGIALLMRDPGFAVVAVGLLALGIGANTAAFSVVDAVLLKPLPFPEPQRMVRVWETPPHSLPNSTTTLTFLDWKRQDALFEALSVERATRAAFGIGNDVVRIPGMLVSADYFNVFGVTAEIGRTFVRGEDQAGATPVVVLSHAFWQTQLGGDPDILKRDLTIDGKPHRVIGVLPAGCFDRTGAQFWKPLIFTPEQLNRRQHWAEVIGRLRAGVSLEQAQAKMNVLRTSLADDIDMADYKDWGFAVEPFARKLTGDALRRSIYLIFGAVLAVLLLACANVANLVLIKAATRQKEMALRAALGASRSRLIAQLLIESVVLCLLGGVAGAALACMILRVAATVLSASLPFTAGLSLDLRVLGFAAASVFLAIVLAGFLPASLVSAKRLSSWLSQARGSSDSSAAIRRVIVIAEIAASVVLISGATLLFKSLIRLQQVDSGITMERVVTMSADLPSAEYARPENATRFYSAVIERLRAVPGVEQVGISTRLPLEGEGWGESLSMPGRTGRLGHIGLKMVDPTYFKALQIPILSGRGIGAQDSAGHPLVVVINQESARQLAVNYGINDPIGRIVSIDVPGYGAIPETSTLVQIIGVIRSERTVGLERPQGPTAYLALAQVPQQDVKFVIRTSGDPFTVVSAIREAVRQIDPHLPLGDIRTMEQVKQQSTLWAKQPTWELGVFAGVAVLLAALGLYGVLAYSVSQRRREIGIRIALGAGRGDVLRQVLRSAFLLLLVGLAGGLTGAVALTRVLKSLLFNVSTLDPAALIVACLTMTLIGMIGTWIPAKRAIGLDPMTVLRDEG